MAASKSAADLFGAGVVPGPAQYAMKVNPPTLPFVGSESLPDYAKLAQMSLDVSERNIAYSDDQYFDEIIKTMDAFKDLIEYVRVNIKTIEMTYNNDRHRRELHLRLLREGFRSMTVQGGPR